MSMNTHIVGLKPPDETWRRMKAVYDACKAAGIDPPVEVEDFFECVPPDDGGVKVLLEPGTTPGVRAYKSTPRAGFDNPYSGFEVVLDDLPKDIKVIRFYNSW